MINPPHTTKKKTVASSSSLGELGQPGGAGQSQKLTLHQLLSIDSVLPAPKEALAGPNAKQKHTKDKYRHLNNKKQLYKMEGRQDEGAFAMSKKYKTEALGSQETLEKKGDKAATSTDPFSKLLPKGTLRDRSWKQPSRGLERSPQGLYTVEELKFVKNRHERLSRGQIDEFMGKRVFKIKKVKVMRGQDASKAKEVDGRARIPPLSIEEQVASGRVGTEYAEDDRQQQKFSGEEEVAVDREALPPVRQQASDGPLQGSVAGPAFGNQLLGTVLQVPGHAADYTALCSVHREDHLQSILRTSKSALLQSPPRGSQPLSVLSLPPGASEERASQQVALTQREAEIPKKPAVRAQPRVATAPYIRPRLKRYNSFNEVKLDSQGSRPLDPDIYEAQKRIDIELATYQTRKAIERLGETSHRSQKESQGGNAADLPPIGKPSKQSQVLQLLQEIERDNAFKKMKDQDFKTAQILRLISSMTAEGEEQARAAGEPTSEVARIKGELLQVIDQIQSKETLTNLMEQLNQGHGPADEGEHAPEPRAEVVRQEGQHPLVLKPQHYANRKKASPTSGRDRAREFQQRQNEKIMALIKEFQEREKAFAHHPDREKTTQSRRLLTFLQRNLLFEQNRLGEPAKDSKSLIEEQIERDLQYLNVFIQPIQNINVFNQPSGPNIEVRRQETASTEQPSQEEVIVGTPITTDEQLKVLLLNSPLRPLVDARILELQSQVQNTVAACQQPYQTPAYLQMQALNEVLDSVLLCESDARGREEGRQGRGAAAGLSTRDDRPLDPVHQEELRRAKQLKYEIAEQLLPRLLPFARDEGLQDHLKGETVGQGAQVGQLGLKKSADGERGSSLTKQGTPALHGIDIGQSMLSDHKIVFEMDRIHKLQSKLANLVTEADSGHCVSKEAAMTFLTEHYPADKVLMKEDLSQKQAELRTLLWPKDQHHLRPRRRQIIDAAKHVPEQVKAAREEEELQITDYHVSRRRQLTAILDKIDKSRAEVQRMAETFTVTSTQKQTLLYLCFIECARQIAKHSKTQALLITKIFHEYFTMTQQGIRGVVGQLHRHLKDVSHEIERLTATVKCEYHNSLSKDIDTARLRHDFEKISSVLETAVRNLYLEEARRLSAELKLDLFGHHLKLVFPNAAEYLVEKNVDDEAYMKEELRKREEQRRNEQRGDADEEGPLAILGSGQQLDGEEAGGVAANEASKKMEEEEVREETRRESDRLDIRSKSLSWNEQVQRLRRRIVRVYGLQGYPSAEENETLDNRAGAGYDGGKEATEIAPFSDAKTRQMHEKMTGGRSWGRPRGDYQAPGIAIAEQRDASDEIYQLVLADLDRLLRVLPVKTELEKSLDAQKAEQKQLARAYAQLEKAQERHEKDLAFLQARCSELTQELVDRQTQQLEQLNRLKKEHLEELERVEGEAKEAAILELQVPTADAQVMTVVDGEAERILRQREFNQRLLQYRSANLHYKEKAPATTKQHEDLFTLAAPPTEHCYPPIAAMLRAVRQGKSRYQQVDLKSVKNVLKMVASLLQAKITAMSKMSKHQHLQYDHLAMMNIDAFYYHHMQQTYGLDQLANKYSEIYLASIEAHRSRDTRLELFRKFVGLDIDKLPYSIFERYVTMIKATNIPVQNLFTMALSGVYVEYPRVRYIFKELLLEASDLIHKQVYQQLQTYTKVVSGNPTLGKYLELEEYEVFRDLQDQTIRSRFKTNAMMLKSLFIELNIQTDELDSDSDGDQGSSQAPKFVTKRQFVEFLLSNFDLTDYSRGNFNCSPKKTVQRVEAMVDKIFILAQGAVGDAMTPRQMMAAFREKIEVKLPVAAFFHIGINACAHHENDENQHYEGVYQFYTQCDVETDEVSAELVARAVHLRLNMEGMSFDQFMLFLVDTNCPVVASGRREAAFEIFKSGCESRNRSALLCEDFLEALRKHRIVPTLEACERAMHDREILLAKELRIQLAMHGEPVPDWLAVTAARQLMADVGRGSPLPAGRKLQDHDQVTEAVEALKREQAEIQRRASKRRELNQQEHLERAALEKAQGLAKLAELTGAGRRRTFKPEVLAEFLTSTAREEPKASQSQSPTIVKPRSSGSFLDGPASVVIDKREGAATVSVDVPRDKPPERAPPDGRQFTVGLRPESESPTSPEPEDLLAGDYMPKRLDASAGNEAAEKREGRSGAFAVQASMQPSGRRRSTKEEASKRSMQSEGSQGPLATSNGGISSTTPYQRRTVLIKADPKQPQQPTSSGLASKPSAAVARQPSKTGTSHDPEDGAESGQGQPETATNRQPAEQTPSEEEYGSEY